jgi:hypothetical protein
VEPKARDVIGASLLAAVLIGLVAVLFFLAWQNAR